MMPEDTAEKPAIDWTDEATVDATPSTGLLGKPVGAVTSAIRVLRYLSAANSSVRASRVARDLQLNTSTCFNILRTLTHENLLDFDTNSKTYRIGYGIMDIARKATFVGGGIGIVRPFMERIAREHGVTVTLWRRISDTRMMLILAALSPNSTRIQMSIGQRLPLLVGAGGRVVAAYAGLTSAELKRHFKEVRWARPLSFDAFEKQVEETRMRGWAVDEGDYAWGTISISVPIFNDNQFPVLACTATMFANQNDPATAARLAQDLAGITRAVPSISESL